MTDANLNLNVSGQGAPPPVEETTSPPPTTTTATPPPNPTYQSSIAPSSAQQIEESADASVPVIPYPVLMQFFDELGFSNQVGGIDAVSAGRLWDLKQSEIVLDILSKWNDSIKKDIAARHAIESSPDEIRKNEERRSISHVLDVVLAASVAQNPEATNPAIRDIAIPLVTVGLVFAGTGGVRDGLFIDTLSTDLVGVNPSSNQAPVAATYTPDMRAELGLLGAALLAGASYVANSRVVFAGGEQELEKITAKAYAEQIIALISSGALTSLVYAIAARHTEPGKPPDPELVRNLETQMKLILLASALAALYKSAPEGGTGWIGQGDFLGLVSGENKTFGPHKELMNSLLNQMRGLFNSLPDGGAGLKASLALFFEENPELSVLTNPARLFAALRPYVQNDPGQAPA